MSTDEELLIKLANRIKEDNNPKYNFHFIRIINFLQKNFNISEGTKAGSIEKGLKIKGHGDLDIYFYIEKLETKNFEEIRDEIIETLSKKYPNPEKKEHAIRIKLKSDETIDIVLKEKNIYQKEKKLIKHIKNINETRKNVIRLVKFWKYETNFVSKRSRSFFIERYAIYSQGNSLISIINDTITQIGGNAKTAREFLLKEAKKK